MVPRILIVDGPNVRHTAAAILELLGALDTATHTLCISDTSTVTDSGREMFRHLAGCTRIMLDFDWQMTQAWNRERFVELFYPPVPPHKLEPNPLRIQMRAVNTRRVCRVIRQPCWRAGRWKSLT